MNKPKLNTNAKKMLIAYILVILAICGGYFGWRYWQQKSEVKATAWTNMWIGSGAQKKFAMRACKLPLANNSDYYLAGYRWKLTVAYAKSTTYHPKYYYGAASYSRKSTNAKLKRKTISSWWGNQVAALDNLPVKRDGYVRTAIKTKKRGTYLSNFKSINDVARCDEI